MEKKCKVVMLATKEKVDIGAPNWWLQGQKKLIINNLISNLYITSDDEIKEGDWIYNFETEEIIQCIGKGSLRNWKKILASTDKSLNLPSPSEQFIQKYIESYNKGNVITEVTVEYEEYMKQGIFNKGDDTHYFDVKINPDNTINIKLIKDSWNREEIEEIIWNYKNYLNTENETVFGDTDKWIKENLL